MHGPLAASVGSSTRLDPVAAGQEAAAAAGPAGAADGAIVLATTAFGPGIAEVFESVESALGVPTVGASVHGVLAPGLEVAGNPAVVVLQLSGVAFEPFHLETEDPEEVGSQLPATRPGELAVVFPDASAKPGGSGMLRALAAALAPGRVVGVAMSEVKRGHGLAWCHGDLVEGACVGVLLGSAGPAWVGVTQGCRIVDGVREVTRARGRWVSGIAGEPAIDRYLASAGVLGDDLESLAARLLVGLGPRRGVHEGLGAGGLRMRSVVGFDPRRGAIGLPDEVRTGSAIAFAIQDAAHARSDLRALTSAASPAAPALYFSCTTRGASLFEHVGMESGLLESGLPGAAFVGAQGPFQVGPLVANDRTTALAGSEVEVLTRAGVLAVLG